MLCKREGEVCTVLECLDKDILVQVGLTVDFFNLPNSFYMKMCLKIMKMNL